jgi:hypothetical protein
VSAELIPRDAVDAMQMAHHMILTAGGPTPWTAMTVDAVCQRMLSPKARVRRFQMRLWRRLWAWRLR